MSQRSRITETRIGPDGKARLYSKMSQEYDNLMDMMPEGFKALTKQIMKVQPEEDLAELEKFWAEATADENPKNLIADTGIDPTE